MRITSVPDPLVGCYRASPQGISLRLMQPVRALIPLYRRDDAGYRWSPFGLVEGAT